MVYVFAYNNAFTYVFCFKFYSVNLSEYFTYNSHAYNDVKNDELQLYPCNVTYMDADLINCVIICPHLVHQIMATTCKSGDNILLSYVNAGYHSVPLTGSVC